jgi:hypothetical protein
MLHISLCVLYKYYLYINKQVVNIVCDLGDETQGVLHPR